MEAEANIPKREKYDVIVIGGGPAGSTAATLVAKEGHDVLLLDRERFPRFRLGESLMPATYWTLQRLGVLEKLSCSHFPKKHSVQFFSKSGSGKISELIRNNFDVEELFGETFNGTYITGRFNAWMEYSATYARTVLDNPDHKLSVGITPKLLAGQGSGYFDFNNLEFQLQNGEKVLNFKGDLQFGYNSKLDQAISFTGQFHFV